MHRDALLFLKLYDGYPEPISLTLRWSIYGFFWKQSVKGSSDVEATTRIVAIASMAMINQVYQGKVMALRRNQFTNDLALKERAKKYDSSGHPWREWNIGQIGAYAGFHCSWYVCFTLEAVCCASAVCVRISYFTTS